RQQIFDLTALRGSDPITAEENMRANLSAMRQVLAYWRQTERWPDGLVFIGHEPELVDACIRADPVARERLADLRLAMCSTREFGELAQWQLLSRPIKWFVVTLAEMTDLAVAGLQDQLVMPREPRREYARNILVLATEGAKAHTHPVREMDQRAIAGLV